MWVAYKSGAMSTVHDGALCKAVKLNIKEVIRPMLLKVGENEWEIDNTT